MRSEKNLELPIINEDSIGKYYATYYTDPKVDYWGKIIKTFEDDEDSTTSNKVEIDFLHKKHLASDLERKIHLS